MPHTEALGGLDLGATRLELTDTIRITCYTAAAAGSISHRLVA